MQKVGWCSGEVVLPERCVHFMVGVVHVLDYFARF